EERLHRAQADQRAFRWTLEQRVSPADQQLQREHGEHRREQDLGRRDPPSHDAPTRTLAELPAGLGDAFGALVADRSGSHALGQDRAVAPGAMHTGLHVRVAITMLHRRRRAPRLLTRFLGHAGHPTGSAELSAVGPPPPGLDVDENGRTGGGAARAWRFWSASRGTAWSRAGPASTTRARPSTRTHHRAAQSSS